ncbi:Formylglycine-generating enzyme [Anaerolineae bacterium]|nr:Formylglycine-generating enzyme [Anaerolineae bacterium]
MSERIGKDGKRMILIPEGWFLMGTSDSDCGGMTMQLGWKREWFADEMPQHRVYLDAFYIDETPVTNLDYKKFLLANPRIAAPSDWDAKLRTYLPGRGDHPVVCVSWDDANAYAHWAGKRLPTEAEWEKAARGVDGRLFPWGNHFDAMRFNSKESEIGGTTSVTRYAPHGNSPFGVMDMVGNTWEWCADFYDAAYYKSSPERNPRGPASSDWRVLRGGAWDTAPDCARCASRDYIAPEMGYATVGFRCVGVVG